MQEQTAPPGSAKRLPMWLRASGPGLPRCTAALAGIFFLCALALGGCTTLPSLAGRTSSTALADGAATRIGQAVAPLAAAHPGASGVHALPDGRDAFTARMLLAQAAERSLDVQYYIWHQDITGTLLFAALRAAAERGVRVRLLLDDNNTAGLDPMLSLLNAQPNIEVRLFNPFVLRSGQSLAYLTDFFRLNRRMHNKSFTADNQVTIVGGRNIGDEYFGAAGEVLFADLDVMALGPVVLDVSRDFDRYWNSDSAYPLAALVPPAGPDALAQTDTAAARVAAGPAAAGYMAALRASPFTAQLLEKTLPLEWAATRLVSDDPSKVLGKAPPGSTVMPQLKPLLGDPVTELDLVSPYFVPSQKAVDAFIAMAARGVQVNILTNSLEATDVAAVHAGYAKWRKPLLEGGVALYELRRAWPQGADRKGSGPLGSSASSLHAKTFSVDRSRVFIGSYNFDPRSAELNTEMGVVIDSPALAGQIAAALRRDVPRRAYRVRLDDQGRPYWTEQQEGHARVYTTEPGTGFLKRLGVGLLSLLPIDWML